jgi:hypothetical protein
MSSAEAALAAATDDRITRDEFAEALAYRVAADRDAWAAQMPAVDLFGIGVGTVAGRSQAGGGPFQLTEGLGDPREGILLASVLYLWTFDLCDVSPN